MLAALSIIIVHWSTQLAAGQLLYPANTVLQLTSSVSVPVSDLPPKRRIAFDWGFQMNYNMPYDVASFYNAPIWPALADSRRTFRAPKVPAKLSNATRNTNRHRFDFSAGELYRALQQLIVEHDFHETCLLRSVCELAQHPFHDQERNVFTALLTFVLKPSWHEGFAASEARTRQSFEAAEWRGLLGENCTRLHPDCKCDLLSVISKVVTGVNTIHFDDYFIDLFLNEIKRINNWTV